MSGLCPTSTCKKGSFWLLLFANVGHAIMRVRYRAVKKGLLHIILHAPRATETGIDISEHWYGHQAASAPSEACRRRVQVVVVVVVVVVVLVVVVVVIRRCSAGSSCAAAAAGVVFVVAV